MENYYQLFNLSNYSTLDEIKSQYQQMIKLHHPDKLHSTDPVANKNSAETFLKLNEAWKVLKNVNSKADYDAKLKQFESENDFAINEVVSIDQFERSNKNCELDCLVYFCRCGGNYELLNRDADDTSIIIGCSNCSLFIQVLFGN